MRPLTQLPLIAVVLATTLLGCGCSDDTDELESGLRAVVHADATQHSFISNGVSVRLHDGRILRAAHGHTDPAATRAYDLATTEQVVGSVTKLYTAVLVLQLVEQGRVGLDDPVTRWVDFPGASAITVRMLLTHTSGLAEYLDLMTLEQLGRAWTPPELVALATAAPALGHPGMAKAIYSNTNFVVLAMIVEAATQTSWAANVQQHIVRPLGLRHTYYVGERPRGPQLAGGWVKAQTGWLDTLTLFDPSVGWGMGAMVSTNAELLRFTEALFDGELFGDPATLTAMRTYSIERDPAYLGAEPPGRMGLGIMTLEAEGITLEGHLGHIEGFHAAALRDRDTGALIVVTSNDNRAWAGLTALKVASYLRAQPGASARADVVGTR
ncbi:MAG: beta-lactamase family protein [Deltaproteobacteria bacterium]|nr:beta-lactamase family protein [Deltaproteobacteria bacterium]